MGIGEAADAAEGANMPMDDATYQILDQEFQKVLDDMGEDESTEVFRSQYGKLLQTLRTSSKSQKQLLNKCRELTAEVAAGNSRIEGVRKILSEEQDKMETLKKNYERAKTSIENLQKKEGKSRETINALKAEIAALIKEKEKSASDQHDDRKLMKMREELIEERDNLLLEVNNLKEGLESKTEECTTLKKTLREKCRIIEEFERDLAYAKTDIQKETRKREKTDRELMQCKQDNKEKESRIAELEKLEAEAKNLGAQLDKQLKAEKEIKDKLQKDLEVMTTDFQNLKTLHENQSNRLKQVLEDSAKMSADLKKKEIESRQMKEDIAQLKKMNTIAARKVKSMEQHKMASDSKVEELKMSLLNLEKELDASKVALEKEQKTVADLKREKLLLTRNLTASENNAAKLTETLKAKNHDMKLLNEDMKSYRLEADRHLKLIGNLERERNRFVNEVVNLTTKTNELLDEIRLHQNRATDYEKYITETESQLKQMKNLYEAACNDRNMFSKSFKEAKDSETEQKEKVAVLNHYIDQLKEELRERDAELYAEKDVTKKLQDEKRILREDYQKQVERVARLRVDLKHKLQYCQRLEHIILEKEKECMLTEKKLKETRDERNVLGTQLLRRNDEISLLYERMKIQEITITRGEQQYKMRIDDMRLFKQQILELKEEKKILVKNTNRLNHFKRELIRSQKNLLKEEMKNKALEEELHNPMNVHRWRVLEGTDPDKLELILKTNALQKRLTAKTEEVADKDQMLFETNRACEELRKLLAQQPSPDIVDQLQLCKKNLREKTQQVKSLASQVNMLTHCMAEYKEEIERQKTELTELKKAAYMQKKKDQLYQQTGRAQSAFLPDSSRSRHQLRI